MTAATNFADAATIKFDLDVMTETLQLIVDWRDDLLSRIARAQIRFELIGFDEGEEERLVDEVAAFRRFCAAVGWRGKAAI